MDLSVISFIEGDAGPVRRLRVLVRHRHALTGLGRRRSGRNRLAAMMSFDRCERMLAAMSRSRAIKTRRQWAWSS
jgi:hypothetical protein